MKPLLLACLAALLACAAARGYPGPPRVLWLPVEKNPAAGVGRADCKYTCTAFRMVPVWASGAPGAAVDSANIPDKDLLCGKVAFG